MALDAFAEAEKAAKESKMKAADGGAGYVSASSMPR